MIRTFSSKYNKRIGKQIRKWRKDKAMSQQQVSDACMLQYGFYICQRVISNIECGKRSIFAVDFVVLCSVLGVVPEQALQDLQSVFE